MTEKQSRDVAGLFFYSWLEKFRLRNILMIGCRELTVVEFRRESQRGGWGESFGSLNLLWSVTCSEVEIYNAQGNREAEKEVEMGNLLQNRTVSKWIPRLSGLFCVPNGKTKKGPTKESQNTHKFHLTRQRFLPATKSFRPGLRRPQNVGFVHTSLCPKAV